MGCCHSSLNRIDVENIFDSKDILYLTQSWSIIKVHDLHKFGHEILLRIINQNILIRQYWRSKVDATPNNYDYSQSDSCLRTDLSWHINLRDYSNQYILILDQLLSVIQDNNRFQTFIKSINISEDIFQIEYETLLLTKKSIIEILYERFKMFNYDFTIDYERVWNKLLTYIIECIVKEKNAIRLSTAIKNEQSFRKL